jgi:hypothetical protein
MLRFKSADAVFPRLLRAFSGGIILALALVHIIPEVRGVLCCTVCLLLQLLSSWVCSSCKHQQLQ